MTRPRSPYPKVFVTLRTGVRQAALIRAHEAPFGKHRVHVLGAKRSIVVDAVRVHAAPEIVRERLEAGEDVGP